VGFFDEVDVGGPLSRDGDETDATEEYESLESLSLTKHID
jgi:hypothetical protein